MLIRATHTVPGPAGHAIWLTRRLALLGALATAGCALLPATPPALRPPPPATEAQVAREHRFIQAQFRTSACFAALKQADTPAALPGQPDEAYTVPLPAPALMHDGFSYTVVVRKSDRMGYLIRSGGLAGVHEQVGPRPLQACLQPVFSGAAPA